MSIYDQIRGEMLVDPDPPELEGENDHLVRVTDNSLRPADLALPQPPQDPNWRPPSGNG